MTPRDIRNHVTKQLRFNPGLPPNKAKQVEEYWERKAIEADQALTAHKERTSHLPDNCEDWIRSNPGSEISDQSRMADPRNGFTHWLDEVDAKEEKRQSIIEKERIPDSEDQEEWMRRSDIDQQGEDPTFLV